MDIITETAIQRRPFPTAENNPDSGTPFTFETGLRPRRRPAGGASPSNNALKGPGREWMEYIPAESQPQIPPSRGMLQFPKYSGNAEAAKHVQTNGCDTTSGMSHLVVTGSRKR